MAVLRYSWGRVGRAGLVSILVCVMLALLPAPARAHEVLPAIADLERDGGILRVEVRANVEGFLAGIDLSAISDTNDAPEAETYDALRALSPSELAFLFESSWPDLAPSIVIEADGTGPLPLTFVSVAAADTPDIDLPRETVFVFTADLPQGAQTASFGWDRAFGALVLRQQGVEAPFDAYLEPGARSAAFLLAGGSQAGPWQTFLNYIPVGIDHIVPMGLDHILFVLGLFFLAPRLAPLLWQVSAFTLAHTITLALAALGYVRVPAEIVEPLIAASIVYVAVENILRRGLSPWRPAVIFGFGLLHGLGFASVLAEFGLPQQAFVPALIGFNIGVELGQLLVIAVALVAVLPALRIDRGADGAGAVMGVYGLAALAFAAASAWAIARAVTVQDVPLAVFLVPLAALFALCLASVWRRDELDAYRRFVSVPASAAIALVGAWWVVERVFL